MPTQIHFVADDNMPLTVDEDPAQVQVRLGSGRGVIELHTEGQPIYLNPAAITFFSAESPRKDAVESPPW
jgi:hypothetical protein